MEQAWDRGPGYYAPLQRYTKPLHKRLFFWLGLSVALALIAILWSFYA